MPQGQAAVTWSDGKDVELFLTVLAVQKISIDYKAVAAAFGPNIPASCIQSRMKILRKKAAEMGVTPQVQESPAKTPNKRGGPTTGGSSAKKAKGKKGGKSTIANSDDDDDDVIEIEEVDGLKDADDDDAAYQPSTQAPLNHPETPSLSPDDENPTNGATAHQTPEAPKRKIVKPRAPRRKSVKPPVTKEPLSAEIFASGSEGEDPVEIKHEVKTEDVDANAAEVGVGAGAGAEIPMFNGEI